MNEKIKELIKQAGAIEIKVLGKLHIPEALVGINIERFAELIVRECYQVCKNNLTLLSEYDSDEAFKYNEGVADCAILIKRHFGVE